METHENVWHAVIRDEHGVLRCMDPGCPFNNRRPGPDGKRDMRHHRATDLLPSTVNRSARTDRPERRQRSVRISD